MNVPQYSGLTADELPECLIHVAVSHKPELPPVEVKPYFVEPKGPATKLCKNCKKEMHKRPNEFPHVFKKRKYCSNACASVRRGGQPLRPDEIEAIQAMARTSQYTIHEIANALGYSISVTRKYCGQIGYRGFKGNEPAWDEGAQCKKS